MVNLSLQSDVGLPPLFFFLFYVLSFGRDSVCSGSGLDRRKREKESVFLVCVRSPPPREDWRTRHVYTFCVLVSRGDSIGSLNGREGVKSGLFWVWACSLAFHLVGSHLRVGRFFFLHRYTPPFGVN